MDPNQSATEVAAGQAADDQAQDDKAATAGDDRDDSQSEEE
ncbi:MAG TPA: hypothetical protein VLI92_02840 [Candidatus Saccharimonadales bacterium]|nr:hypothetical protein [Candidatus Saccharimonadales bacterium]